ncbi:hypothetical protein GJ496_001924 [Pomphorhynchus laevis]|nr:hypothetical protein GJ496_001924 [Pomphorhynchus laevis]
MRNDNQQRRFSCLANEQLIWRNFDPFYNDLHAKICFIDGESDSNITGKYNIIKYISNTKTSTKLHSSKSNILHCNYSSDIFENNNKHHSSISRTLSSSLHYQTLKLINNSSRRNTFPSYTKSHEQINQGKHNRSRRTCLRTENVDNKNCSYNQVEPFSKAIVKGNGNKLMNKMKERIDIMNKSFKSYLEKTAKFKNCGHNRSENQQMKKLADILSKQFVDEYFSDLKDYQTTTNSANMYLKPKVQQIDSTQNIIKPIGFDCKRETNDMAYPLCHSTKIKSIMEKKTNRARSWTNGNMFELEEELYIGNLSIIELETAQVYAYQQIREIESRYNIVHKDVSKHPRSVLPSDNKFNCSNRDVNNIFGIPINHVQRKQSGSLPVRIIECMLFLLSISSEYIDLFRKPAVKSKIAELKRKIKSGNDLRLKSENAFAIADIIRLYLRELPQSLISSVSLTPILLPKDFMSRLVFCPFCTASQLKTLSERLCACIYKNSRLSTDVQQMSRIASYRDYSAVSFKSPWSWVNSELKKLISLPYRFGGLNVCDIMVAAKFAFENLLSMCRPTVERMEGRELVIRQHNISG